MDRADFFKQLWKFLFRPLIILMVVYYSIKFIIAVFSESGVERNLTVFILSLTIVSTIIYLISSLIGKTIEKIYTKLSEKAKFRWLIIARIWDYLSLLMLGALLYHMWLKDAIFASLFVVVLIGERAIAIVKEEKSKR